MLTGDQSGQTTKQMTSLYGHFLLMSVIYRASILSPPEQVILGLLRTCIIDVTCPEEEDLSPVSPLLQLKPLHLQFLIDCEASIPVGAGMESS